MASNAELSTHARKLQEDEIERLVKCRIRSEIESRKAAEATMKRAVQEARELKKELVIMRQEKEELRQDSRKTTMVAATTPTLGGAVTRDDLQKRLAQEKAKRKEQATLLEQSHTELARLREQLEQREVENQQTQAQRVDAQRKNQEELNARQREVETLQEEAKKLKAAADEAKRKCQRAGKDKKEALQQLMDENAQLTKRCEALERLGEENVKLRKLLEKSKVKQGSVSEDWQRKLDQREQAFLRQEQENKKQMADQQQEIERLLNEKDELVAKVVETESELMALERNHEAQLDRERQKYQELVASTKQVQERLLTLKDAGRAADRARLDAEARLAQATELRETAEAAADAVESRAEKAELQLNKARLQLEQLEQALKKKGITIDYLLKKSAGSTRSSNITGSNNPPSQSKAAAKELKEPEDSDSEESVVVRPTKTKTSAARATALSTNGSSHPIPADKFNAAVRVGVRAAATTKPRPTKSALLPSSREPTRTSNNERERTPERASQGK